MGRYLNSRVLFEAYRECAAIKRKAGGIVLTEVWRWKEGQQGL